MKVSFDYQVFSLQKYGGASRYFCELAHHLHPLPGISATINSPLYVTEYLEDLDKKQVRGIKVLEAKFTNTFRVKFSRNAFRLLSAINKPDIIHKTYYFPYPSGKTPTVVTVYDMIPEKLPQYYPTTDTAIKRDACKSATKIICISQSTKKDLCGMFEIPENRVDVIHLSHSMGKVSLPTDSSGRLPGYPYLFFVGRRDGYKNFEKLLESLRVVKGIRDFGLVCFGGGAFSAHEQELLRKSGLPSDRVLQISGSDGLLALFYKHAELFVFPSEYEGFGIPLLEAFHWGCPIACSSGSSFDEVAGDAALKFDSHDTDQMAHAIQKGLEMGKLANPLVQSGFDMLKRYSWNKCALETKAVYEQCL